MDAHPQVFLFWQVGGPWGDRMMIRHTPVPSQNAYDILKYHIQQDAMQFRHRGEGGTGGMVNKSRTSLMGELTLAIYLNQ